METYEARFEVNVEWSWDGDQQVVLEAAKQLVDKLDKLIADQNMAFRVKGQDAMVHVESGCAVFISLNHVGAVK